MKEEKLFDIVNSVDDDLICEMLEYSPDTKTKGGEYEGELYFSSSAPEKPKKTHYWQYPAAAAAVMLALVGVLFIFNANSTLPHEKQPDGEEQTTTGSEPAEDPAGIDGSMPSPFPEGADGDENSLFYMPGKRVLNNIPAELMRVRDETEVNEWIQSFPSIKEAPSGVDGYANLYTFITHFNITREETETALSAYLDSDDESIRIRSFDLDFIFDEDVGRVSRWLSNIYAIVVDENAYCPNWVYTHTAEDYQKAGITVDMIIAQAPLYAFFDLTDEARAAFEKKLSDYTGTAVEFVNAAQSYPVNLLRCRPGEERYYYGIDKSAVTRMDDYDLFRQYFFGTWEWDTGEWYWDDPFVVDDSLKSFNMIGMEPWCIGEFYRIGDNTLVFGTGGMAGGPLFWLDMNEPEILYSAEGSIEDGLWVINGATEPGFCSLKKTDLPPNEPEENFLSIFRLREISRDYGIDFSLLVDISLGYTEDDAYYSMSHNVSALFYPIYLVSESADRLEFRTTVGNGFEAEMETELSFTIEKLDGKWVRTLDTSILEQRPGTVIPEKTEDDTDICYSDYGLSSQTVSDLAVTAFLSNDSEELSKYLADPSYEALSEGSENIYGRVTYMTWNVYDLTEKDGIYSMIYNIALDNAEMLIHLDVGMREIDGEWKVEYIYLQG